MKKQKPNLTGSKPVSNTDEQPKSLVSSDYFSCLPDEMIFKIFRGLSKRELKHCSAVCRRWRKISSDYRLELWSKVSIQHETLTLAHLAEVVERGVRTLQLCHITIADSDTSGTPFTPNYDSRLEDLIAVRPNISTAGLASIVECTSHLVKLDISRCILDQRIANAISKNTEMRILRLNGCQGLNEMVMPTILKGCQKIQELGLCWTRLSRETLDAMIPHLSTSLSHLDICHCGPHLVDERNALRALVVVYPESSKLLLLQTQNK